MTSKEAIDLFMNGDYSASKLIFDQLLIADDLDDTQRADLLFNLSSCLGSLERYEESLECLSQIDNKSSDVQYSKALCHYKLLNYNEALALTDSLLNEINIEHSIDSLQTDIDNQTIENSYLIQVINLNSAIKYELNYPDFKNKSKQSLNRLPYKRIEDYDAVSLHNLAIFDYNSNQNSSIDKLNYLFKSEVEGKNYNQPKETVENLLLMLIDQNYFEEVQSLLNTEELRIKLDESIRCKEKIEFFDIISQPKPIEATIKRLNKFFSTLLIENKQANNDEDLNNLIQAIVTYLISYYWSRDEFKQVEEILLQAKLTKDICWKTNLANTIYMTDTRYEEASRLYEELLSLIKSFKSNKQNKGTILNVNPVVLGNLCVSYVLTGRNSEAESLIKEVEAAQQEELASDKNINTLAYINNITSSSSSRLKLDDVENFEEYAEYLYQNNRSTMQPTTHLCVINLIISTLYCLKNNYEFGLTRMFKNLDPIKEKLNTETWYQAKRCILSLLDANCKQMVNVYDNLFNRIVEFLIECERYGLFVETKLHLLDEEFNSVTYEARYLRSIILTMIHDK